MGVKFSAYAVPTFGGYADHTYVASQDGKAYRCWGSAHGGHSIVSGTFQNTKTQDNYRCGIKLTSQQKQSIVDAIIAMNAAAMAAGLPPIADPNDVQDNYPDTAGIGLYAINGVCHQSANCFMWETGKTLNFSVQCYWLSVSLFGVYGSRYNLSPAPKWKNEIYNPAKANKSVNCKAMIPFVETLEAPHSELVQDTFDLTQRMIPDLEGDEFKDIHVEILEEKNALIMKHEKGIDLGRALNDTCNEFQLKMMERVGKSNYAMLNGTRPGEVISLIPYEYLVGYPYVEALVPDDRAEASN